MMQTAPGTPPAPPSIHPRRRGFALVAILLTVSILATLVSVNFARSAVEQSVARRSIASGQAFFLAEAGADHLRYWLQTSATPLPPSPFWLVPGDLTPVGMTKALGYDHTVNGGSYSIFIEPGPGAPPSYYRATITGQATDYTPTNRTVRVTFTSQTTQPFPEYAYFSDQEGDLLGSVWWITNFGIRGGPFITNDALHISGSPVFDGNVQAIGGIVCDQGCPPYDGVASPTNDTPVFTQGPPTVGGNSAIRPMVSLTALRDQAQSIGLLFIGNTSISFSNGTLAVSDNIDATRNGLYTLPENSVLFVDAGNLLVKGGTLDGSLTAATSGTLGIAKNVVYACDPTRADPSQADVDADCLDGNGQATNNNDTLGLVAQQDVELWHDPLIGWNDLQNLTLHASIVSVNGGFVLKDLPLAPTLGQLHVLGGVNVKRAVPLAQTAPGTNMVVAGYESAVYEYDPRLKDDPPPLFATQGSNQGEQLLWED